MLIKAEHLKLTLAGVEILSDVHLHIDKGQIYGLLGPNGAGKSTTIAVILGLYQADKGQLELFDEPAEGARRNALRRIGVMPENAGFYLWMRAGEYLSWYAGLYGGLKQSASELLREVGLHGVDSKPIGQFSRGMRQRLGLARALVHAPELLILDEPTNGLDPRGRREIHDLLLNLARERGVGILLCTHLLDDVDRLCDLIGIIHRGETKIEVPLIEILGREGLGRKFKVRLDNVPDPDTLPRGVRMIRFDGVWRHLSLEAEISAAATWQNLMEKGWHIVEVRAEGGGMLEEFYLHLTSEADVRRRGATA